MSSSKLLRRSWLVHRGIDGMNHATSFEFGGGFNKSSFRTGTREACEPPQAFPPGARWSGPCSVNACPPSEMLVGALNAGFI